ncbi:MAG: 3-hydroxyacyl-CoA dehydrogenase NAD-binding domain-containing protein [Cyclonatronaceae bacterium]
MNFTEPFRNVAVLGAGVMGSQIAAHLANAGTQVLLLDIPSESGSPDAVVEKAFKSMIRMKPSPLVTASAARRIQTGNFKDDLEKLAASDWIIEAVVENLEIKHDIWLKVLKIAGSDAVLSTNTSGLPLKEISADFPDDAKRRFLGTHFFNPPRYLKLLEVIPGKETDPEIVKRIGRFGKIALGKGIVIAKDTPNFIANRVGTYAMAVAMPAYASGRYSVEEIDLLTGPITGRPKSATFRTADVVGLDTLYYVSKNLYKAIPHDHHRDDFIVPEVLEKLIAEKKLGAKSGAGFYKKEGKVIKSLNPDTMTYEEPKKPDLGDIDIIRKNPSLVERWKALFADSGRAGEFIREHTVKSVAYSMYCIPEISDMPADIDRAICWGFGWEMGPFRIADAIGLEKLTGLFPQYGFNVPDWVVPMIQSGDTAFYRTRNGIREVWLPGKGYQADPLPEDEITVAWLRERETREIWKNEEAALLDIGDGVTLFEFRSKANTLGSKVMSGLREAIEMVEDGDWLGMVIGNDGHNFSVGANLGELVHAARSGDFKVIEKAVDNFQGTVQRLRYASSPVVLAMRGRALGGGCELAMGSGHVVAAAETYMGLVELGVGLIPAGTGSMHMATRAADKAESEHVSQIQVFLQKAFETIAMTKVTMSAQEAVELGYLMPGTTRIVMHEDRRIYAAKEEVLRLARQGYLPPPVRNSIQVLGKAGRAPLDTAAWMMKQAGYISEYDRYLAGRLAYVLTGGDITGPARVHEDYLIALEKEVFLSLTGEQKTRERIHSILTENKPLRN